MACATLKRTLEWDPLNTSPSTSSATTTNTRPNKRRCLLSQPPFTTASPPRDPSPFAMMNAKITTEDIANNIREEMKRLHNRRQLHFPNSGRTSPTGTSSPVTSAETTPQTNQVNINNNVGLLSPSRRDQPLFTFKQVSLICERLMRERESMIREEYEQLLTSKLAEQYDTFVKFTYDQIQKRFEDSGPPSYLS